MNKSVLMDILDVVIRSLVSISALFILTRLMGKKHIAQLSFFDYVVGISIGSIAASFAIDDSISYLHGLTGIIMYSLLPVIVSFISLKSMMGRMIFDGVPSVLIQDGKLIEKNLRKTKFHINDILEECRMKGAFSISDVEFAVLETSGQVSILLKSCKQPLTPENINIQVKYKGLSADIIIDGVVMYEHLYLVKHDKSWLMSELKKQNVNSPKDVLLATLDSDEILHIDLKNHDPKTKDVLE